MSLDIYLTSPAPPPLPTCPHCGQTIGKQGESDEEEWTTNITHNLSRMAAEAGIYEVTWRAGENNIVTAHHLIEPLERGLVELINRPEHFRQFDAKNGWGTYDHFVPWVQKLLQACKDHPNFTVRASR